MDHERLAQSVAELIGGERPPTDVSAAAALRAARANPNIDREIARHVFEASTDAKVKILAAILLIRSTTPSEHAAVPRPSRVGRGS